jgi:hypothetical protein
MLAKRHAALTPTKVHHPTDMGFLLSRKASANPIRVAQELKLVTICRNSLFIDSSYRHQASRLSHLLNELGEGEKLLVFRLFTTSMIRNPSVASSPSRLRDQSLCSSPTHQGTHQHRPRRSTYLCFTHDETAAKHVCPKDRQQRRPRRPRSRRPMYGRVRGPLRMATPVETASTVRLPPTSALCRDDRARCNQFAAELTTDARLNHNSRNRCSQFCQSRLS